MTDEEASEQADRASAALRDTILQLNDDGLDPQCIVEALIVQAVGLAFAEYGRAEGQYLVEGTVNACFREAARLAPAPNQRTDHPPAGLSTAVHLRLFRSDDLEAEATRGERQSRRPRSEILARGRQKIFETDPALFRRTPFRDVRFDVRDSKNRGIWGRG
jgi:hypothetical protein